LAAAYKESEAVRTPTSNKLDNLISNSFFCNIQARTGEEQRSQRMAAEMNQYRHDMERRLTDKEEELESIK
jgi:hypothetical protein